MKNFVSVSPELATAGQPTESQLVELARQGFEVIINLGLLDPAYCLEDEASLVSSLGMAYHHIPVAFEAPNPDDLQHFFAAMDASTGRRVFVHCAANKRASCFVALYGQQRWAWSDAAADAFIRRVWKPDEVWAAFVERARGKLL